MFNVFGMRGPSSIKPWSPPLLISQIAPASRLIQIKNLDVISR